MTARLRLKVCALAVAIPLTFVAIHTIVSAHAGNSDPSVIHACVGNYSKIVRIVGTGGSCVTAPASLAETPVHWAIQGAAGTNGINGINGTNGTNGASVTFVGYFGGDANGCPNGGAIYALAGTDAYVCNGLNAPAGATRPDPPCFHQANRYHNCGNGTVTDTVTGLIWLQNAACFGTVGYASANQAASGLKAGDCGLTDSSSSGDWRLPTKDEWSATIAHASVQGLACTLSLSPSLTNDAGTGCLSFGPTSFTGVTSNVGYWSSSSDDATPHFAYLANLASGHIVAGGKIILARPWPVRGGSR